MKKGRFQPHVFEGIEPVPCDFIGFYRPQLQAAVGKHSSCVAEKALPAVSVGIIGEVGSVEAMRFALPVAIVCQPEGDGSEKALKKATLARAKAYLQSRQAGIFDAGFEPEELEESGIEN